MKKKKRMIISRSFVLLLSKISSKNPQKKSPKKKNKTDPQIILNPTYTNPKRFGKFVFFFGYLKLSFFFYIWNARRRRSTSSLLFSSPKARAQKKKKKKKKKRDAGPVDPRAAE